MTCMLTEVQLEKIARAMVPAKEATPVRFLKNGQAVNLETGEMAAKGTNVMYHVVYWNFTRALARKIAVWTDTRAVF